MDLAARGAGREEEARQTLLCSASLLRRTPPLRPQIRHGRGHRGGGGRQGRRGQRHGKVGEGPALEVLGGCPRWVGRGEGGGAEHAASLAILGDAPAAGRRQEDGVQVRLVQAPFPFTALVRTHTRACRGGACACRRRARRGAAAALLVRALAARGGVLFFSQRDLAKRLMNVQLAAGERSWTRTIPIHGDMARPPRGH